jgi:hypothetical protein
VCRRLLGFGTRDALDGFLRAHDVFEALARVRRPPNE